MSSRRGCMIERLYLRVYDGVGRRGVGVALAAILLAVGLSATTFRDLDIDMSFRPLFAADDEAAAATRALEAEFGQASGAYVGIVVERPDILTPAFLRELGRLGAALDSLEHVVEVLSLARAPVIDWTGGSPRGVPSLDPELLRSGDDAALRSAITELADAPGARGVLLSHDLRRTLILARLDLPLADLEARGRVIAEMRSLAAARLRPGSAPRLVGVSVVEAAYAEIVLDSLARAFVLTTIAILGVLWLLFRRAASVAVVMAGVALAVPVAVGVLARAGQEITIVNSMVPVMILIIGVADAVHMLDSFAGQVRLGLDRRAAVRVMFGEMARPCLLTTVTTAAGFLALRAADIAAIRDFGTNVAIGVVIVYFLNLVLVPTLLLVLPLHRSVPRPPSGQGRRWKVHAARLATRRPGWIVSAALVPLLAAALAIPRLRVEQRFNEEVPVGHPVRADQSLLEREFTGFLGPEMSLRAIDGRSLLDANTLERIDAFSAAARRVDGVLSVRSPSDLLPPGAAADQAVGLLGLRSDPLVGRQVRELVGSDGTTAVVSVRTADVGTSAAHELVSELERLADVHLGRGVAAAPAGQWWLAQRGMDSIVRDMMASFLTACLLVVPLLAFAVRVPRLVVIGAVTNAVPMIFALGFMAATGISLRIGTAMILAIALGIAIDDTIHLLARIREEPSLRTIPARAARSAICRVAGPITATTAALVLGFLSMASSELLALRDMGLVAAATLTVALLVDLYLLPALYVLSSPRAARLRAGLPAAAPVARTSP